MKRSEAHLLASSILFLFGIRCVGFSYASFCAFGSFFLLFTRRVDRRFYTERKMYFMFECMR